MVWVGGQLLLGLLVLPVLRRRLDAASRVLLTREVGVRFGVFTVVVFLPLQLVTGIALAAHRGLTVSDLAEPGYGRMLGGKVVLVAIAAVTTAAIPAIWKDCRLPDAGPSLIPHHARVRPPRSHRRDRAPGSWPAHMQ